MSDLTGSTPAVTYKSLLKISNTANQVLDGTLRAVEDGLGTDSKLELSTAAVNIAGAGTLEYAGTAITSTAAELNIMDGGTAASATTVVDADRVVFNDNGTMKQVAVTNLAAYFDDEITAMPNLIETGALGAGTIGSGFGSINNGSSTITTTGLITGGSLDISGVASAATFEPDGDTSASDNAAIGYTSAEGLILTGQGSTSDITLKNDADAIVFTVPTGTDDILFPDSAEVIFGAGSDLEIYSDGTHGIIKQKSGGILKLGTEVSGVEVTIGHTTSETTVSDNLTVRGVFRGYQGTQATTDNGATAISAANVLTGIVQCTPTADRSKATDTASNFISTLGLTVNNDSFDFSLINLATDGTSHITITVGANVLLVGCMVVSAQDLAEDAFTSGVGRFRIKRSSGSACTMFRIA